MPLCEAIIAPAKHGVSGVAVPVGAILGIARLIHATRGVETSEEKDTRSPLTVSGSC